MCNKLVILAYITFVTYCVEGHSTYGEIASTAVSKFYSWVWILNIAVSHHNSCTFRH